MVNVVLVDTPALLEECIADVSSGRSLAVDLEGVDLCRQGTLCLLQVLREGGKDIWVVDVTVLGQAAFEPVVSGGQSLKGVLEDGSIVKAGTVSELPC
jgi:exonuclease 3'-5' domain-containing protein 1